MASDTLFREKAPGIMALLMQDFALDTESAAAILGNLGHESGGFRFLQEKQPLIPGSAGGYGWAQWTGPRRRDFESFCHRNNFDPASDTANYKWLWNELKGSEAKAIPAVRNAVGLDEKVRAFEAAFERAGVKSYESRIEWAKKALDAYQAGGWEPLKIIDAVARHEGEALSPIATRDQIQRHISIDVLPVILQSVLPVVLKQVQGGQPQIDIPALIKQVAETTKAQTPPPTAPGTPASQRPSVWLSTAAAIGAALLQAHGDLGTPVGPNATTAGLMTNVLTIGSTIFAAVGGWQGIGKAALLLLKLIPK